MIFSFYIYSQYLVMIIIPYISTVLSTLRQVAHLSPHPHKKQEFRGRCHRTCWRKSHRSHNQKVERCGAVVKRRTRDREVPGSIHTNCKCCFLEQETLSTLLSTGFYPGKKKATWKISTRLLNVLPSINKVDYYYYYLLNKFISFLAVLTWKTGLKKM